MSPLYARHARNYLALYPQVQHVFVERDGQTLGGIGRHLPGGEFHVLQVYYISTEHPQGV